MSTNEGGKSVNVVEDEDEMEKTVQELSDGGNRADAWHLVDLRAVEGYIQEEEHRAVTARQVRATSVSATCGSDAQWTRWASSWRDLSLSSKIRGQRDSVCAGKWTRMLEIREGEDLLATMVPNHAEEHKGWISQHDLDCVVQDILHNEKKQTVADDAKRISVPLKLTAKDKREECRYISKLMKIFDLFIRPWPSSRNES